MPQLPVDDSASAKAMAHEIFGDGVVIVDASYTGDTRSSGIYTDGDKVSPGVTPSDHGVILSTGKVKSFSNDDASNPNQSFSTSTDTDGVDNDADFNALAGTNTYDASWLDVDFIPKGDTLTMQFVFSSDEYPEYANTIYNDAVGVWVNGVPAKLTVGDGSTTVGNINHVDNSNLYLDNTQDQFNTEMDGFTVTMTLKMTVKPGVVNSVRIGIADLGDTSYDSNLLIAGDSLQVVLIAQDDDVFVHADDSVTVDVLDNDEHLPLTTLTVTHINGVPVVAGDNVTLPNGQDVTLNADGTFTIQADSDEEVSAFSYSVSDGSGHSDTAYVTVNTVPCFVAGTLIRTPGGETPVECLKAGDLVLTKDGGAQPLCWVGSRTVPAVGDQAPIRIAAHSFGVHRTLLVSPQHRILIRDGLSELLFGEPEVLVAAKHLLNDKTVTRQVGGTVTYCHLLFEKHQVVFSQGLPSESFLPGPQVSDGFEQDVLDELLTIFPELNPMTGAGYSPSARRTLKRHEAMVLMSRPRAA